MNVSSQTMSIESTIRALSDDQGVLFPGTGEWDFTQEQTIPTVSRPLQENDIDELFDDQNRLPIQISLDNDSKTRTVSASLLRNMPILNMAYSCNAPPFKVSEES